MINTIQEDWESCDMAMYVIVVASVDVNRILADEERLILAARCVFIHHRNCFGYGKIGKGDLMLPLVLM